MGERQDRVAQRVSRPVRRPAAGRPRARPSPPRASTRALHVGYLPEGPVIDWTGEIAEWLEPLAACLRAHGAFAIRLSPPVRTETWSAAKVKEGIGDPDTKRLPDLPSRLVD